VVVEITGKSTFDRLRLPFYHTKWAVYF